MGGPEDNQAPKDIRNFIYRYLDSVELTRVLLLLQASPGRKWTIDELTAELRSSAVGIEKRLSDLYDRQVLDPDPSGATHSYRPHTPEIARTVANLAEYEKKYPYRLIDLIYSRREDALREFTDAFSFKKEKEK